jgi:hypothetical protein
MRIYNRNQKSACLATSITPTVAMTNTRANPSSPVLFGTSRSTTRSAFLNIPLELRDEIASHVIPDDPTTLRIVFDAQPDASSPIQHHSLLYTCKQTQREYTRALLRFPGITATIHNFDFQPLMAFLSRLPCIYLDVLPKQPTSLGFATSIANYAITEANVHLLINMTDDLDAALGVLERWWIRQKRSGDQSLKTTRFLSIHRTPAQPRSTPTLVFVSHGATHVALERS